MAGYPPNHTGYPPQAGSNPHGAANPYGLATPYGSTPNPYGAAPPANPYGAANPYAAAPAGNPYGASPAPNPYGASSYGSSPYGSAPNPYGADKPSKDKPGKDKPQGEFGDKPAKDKFDASAPPFGASTMGFGNPFASLMPSAFPPGTDPNLVNCFTHADQDRSGFIDDKELQRALSGYNQAFSLRTVHLLMYIFTNTNKRVIGPKEFTQVFYSLQNWRATFERFDMDMSGRIDVNELRQALVSLGFAVSPAVLDLLVAKYDKSGGKHKSIEYDNFIECCLTVKGLTEKFKERDTSFTGNAMFTYDGFMMTVLPFLIA